MTLKPRWPRSMTTAGVFRKLRKRTVNASPWSRRMLGPIEGTEPSLPTWGKQSKQESFSSERSSSIPKMKGQRFTWTCCPRSIRTGRYELPEEEKGKLSCAFDGIASCWCCPWVRQKCECRLEVQFPSLPLFPRV